MSQRGPYVLTGKRPTGRPPGIHTPHARRYRLQTAARYASELAVATERVRTMGRDWGNGGVLPTGQLEVRAMQLAMQAIQFLEQIRALRAGGGC